MESRLVDINVYFHNSFRGARERSPPTSKNFAVEIPACGEFAKVNEAGMCDGQVSLWANHPPDHGITPAR